MESENWGKMKKKAFVRYNIDGNKSNVISIKLNAEEREWLDSIKKILNIPMDGKALKQCAIIGSNLLINICGSENLKYLTSSKRTRKKW